MSTLLRVLMIDDSAKDAELVLANLSDTGYQVEAGLADNARDLKKLLREGSWDIALCDYAMPHFNPFDALALLKEYDVDIPFIVITGAIGEENVIRLMKAGCHDCVMKYNLMRLPEVINRELEEARTRKENKELKERLQISYDNWINTFDSISDIISVISTDHEFLAINKAGAESVGLPKEQVIGRKCFHYVHHTLCPIPECPCVLAIETGENAETECTIGDRIFLLQAWPIKDSNGHFSSFVHIVKDITDRKNAEKEIIRAKEAAEAANAAKSQFLANMSHELRTPMNGFMGMMQLLEMTPLTEEQEEYLHVSRESSNLLLAVINDILDYSKIEAGMMKLEEVPFSIRKVLEDSSALFRLAIAKKSLKLESFVEGSIPVHLAGDPFRLRQILSNLIGNAVKYTYDGRIDVSVRLIAETDPGKVKLEFTVKDTGIGIPTEKLEDIFQNFSQADNSNTRKYGGTGLGLAISRKLVNMMAGDIWVESVLGVGSRFHFTCVLQLVASQGPAHVSE